MRTVVLDLDGNRHIPRRFSPLLFPLMRSDGLAWLQAGSERELAAALGRARSLALIHRSPPWQLLCVVDLASGAGGDGPFDGSLREIFHRLHARFLEGFAGNGPVRTLLVAIDTLQRENHTGRPRDPKAAARWELDSRGVLSGSAPAFLFVEEDLTAINEAWGGTRIDFADHATHDGVAALPPGLQESIQNRATAVRRALDQMLQDKARALASADADAPASITARIFAAMRSQFEQALTTRLNASQVAPLADLRPGRDILEPIVEGAFSAEATRGDIALVRLLNSPDWELELAYLTAAFTLAPADTSLAPVGTSRVSLQFDRELVASTYAEHTQALRRTMTQLETDASVDDSIEVPWVTDPDWACREPAPAFQPGSPATFPSLQSSRDMGRWKAWLGSSEHQLQERTEANGIGLAACRRDAAETLDSTIRRPGTRELSESGIKSELEDLNVSLRELRAQPAKHESVENALDGWRRSVAIWSDEFVEASRLRPGRRTFVVSSSLGFLVWLAVATAGRWWDISHGQARTITLLLSATILLASVVAAGFALAISRRRLDRLRRRAVQVLDETNRKLIDSYSASRKAIERMLQITLGCANRDALHAGLSRLHRSRRLRRYHRDKLHAHLENSERLAREFSGAEAGVRSGVDPTWPELDLGRPDTENLLYSPNGARSNLRGAQPVISMPGGQVVTLNTTQLPGLLSVELQAEPVKAARSPDIAMPWGPIAAFALILLALFALLWLANLPELDRPRQAWICIAAPLFALGVVILVIGYAEFARDQLSDLTSRVNDSLGLSIPTAGPTAVVVLNLLLVTSFLLIKVIGRLPVHLAHLALALRRRKHTAPVAVPLGRVARLAYEYDPGRGTRLKSEWWFPRWLLLGLGTSALVLTLLAGAAALSGYPSAIATLPALAALLFLELAWFLGGPPPYRWSGTLQGEPASGQLHGEYESLWQRYQDLWPERRLAAAYRLDPPSSPVPEAVSLSAMTGTDDPALRLARLVRDAGMTVDDFQLDVLRDLVAGVDVVLQNAGREQVDPALFGYLQQGLTAGDRTLVIVDTLLESDAAARWVRDGLSSFMDVDPDRSVLTLTEFLQGQVEPAVLIADLEAAVREIRALGAWTKSLRVVLVPNATGHVGELQAFAGLLNVLQDMTGRRLQHILVAGDRGRLEPALNRSLPIRTREHRPSLETRPAELAAIIWRLEGDSWPQQRLMSGHLSKYLGAEAVFSLPAWEQDIGNIALAGQEALPWREWLEELQGQRALLDPEVVDNRRLHDVASRRIEVLSPSWLARRRPRRCILVRDDAHNLVNVFRQWYSRAEEALLLHVVSPPYLLRDYLADNLDYFERAPLYPLTPRLADGTQRITIDLVERMSAGWLDEATVLSQLRQIDPDTPSVEEGLPALLETVLAEPRSLDPLERLQQFSFEPSKGDFVQSVQYRLSTGFKARLEWMEILDIRDSGGSTLARVRRDHLFQLALPGQQLAIDGKAYTISAFDPLTRKVHLDLATPGGLRNLGEPQYRPRLVVDLDRWQEQRARGNFESVTSSSAVTEKQLLILPYRIITEGYYSFECGVTLAPRKFTYTDLSRQGVPERVYPLGRMLRISIRTPKLSSNVDDVAQTLALLLQEIFVTLFPETHRFLLVLTPGQGPTANQPPFEQLLPRLRKYSSIPDSEHAAWADSVVLYLIEDSHADLGLVQCVHDEWDYILQVLDDYLAWLRDDSEKPSDGRWTTDIKPTPGYLSFGLGDIPTSLELERVAGLLHELGVDEGGNTIRARRTGWRGKTRLAAPARRPTGVRKCDFCSAELSSAEFERLTDGRERCSSCRGSAVNTLEQAERVLAVARDFMRTELGLELRRNIDTRVVNADALQDAIERAFLPTANYDARAVGVAIRDGDRCDVLLENGQPYHMALGAMVHELTHVWQFDNLRYRRHGGGRWPRAD